MVILFVAYVVGMSGCTQCGSCCKKFGARLEASALDIARWRLEDRADILSHVGFDLCDGEVVGGRLWVDENGDRVKECPFLELRGDKYYCGIHESKPEVCTWHYCINYL
jgi:Fe-S-cluster containining protein